MARFLRFKEGGLAKIATSLGYTGDMSGFQDYLEKNPILKDKMKKYEDSAVQMASKAKSSDYQQTQEQAKNTVGQFVPPPKQTFETTKMATGGVLPQAYVPTLGTGEGQVDAYKKGQKLTDVTASQAQTGAMPVGAVTQATGIKEDTKQIIDAGTGKLGDQSAATQTQAGAIDPKTGKPTAAQATAAKQPLTGAESYTADEKKTDVETALTASQAAEGTVRPESKVIAAQQTKSAVSDLDSAQGSAVLLENPTQRKIQDGELISGAANAETASKFTEQIQAATALPSEKATVQGQLASLTENFDATNPPPWAAGALRGVQAAMAQRGLGASSMAGQAMVQAALESAFPIASADAQTTASFEAQNLSNRQQRAMLAAEQRAKFMGQEFDQAFQSRVQNASKISDIANMNFTADQQIALENSRAANTMELSNLSNKQALVMSEASALANLDMSNLSNRQQAAVQNAQSFLQMDMQNLSNEQQKVMFDNQSIVQSLFNDQAATNAARQFNAQSQNEVDQYFAGLQTQVSQFNASQTNAQDQFNAGEANALSKFNREVDNQRDQFNATNALAIAQNNAVWRREIATKDTAAVNRVNELNAKAALDISNTAYNNMWNYYADTMEWAWTSAESELGRIKDVAIANIDAESRKAMQNAKSKSSAWGNIGSLIGTLGSAWITGKS
tara:strand:- start:2934 stop:4964 length:2031 start_codon:yes stop_codon:yes gene_type:complete